MACRGFPSFAGSCAVLAVLCVAAPAAGQVLKTDPWITNGTVRAMAVSNNVLYLGGEFTEVGPETGSGVAIDAVTGDPLPRFPVTNGNIAAVAADGSGGWYIGGEFTEVQGQPRAGLARLAPSGDLVAWNPAPNYNGSAPKIYSIVVHQGIVYVGGVFTQIAGQARNYLAAFDVASGALTAWDPNPNGTIFVLAASGSTVYASGYFALIGGQSRYRLAALDASTAAATAWNPNPNTNSLVKALTVGGGLVYAGGTFTDIGGHTRNRLAAIDATGASTAWNPNPNGEVDALAVDGTTLYIGGQFTNVALDNRNRLAAFDLGTGLTNTWNPNAGGTVSSLAVSGSTVYAGGTFTAVGGQSRPYLAAIGTNGVLAAWNPRPDALVNAVAAGNGVVFAGGSFNTVGAKPRNRLAALDAGTGALLPWNPGANGIVYSLVANGPHVYTGGSFSTIGGQARSNIARIDTSGAVAAWNPGTNGVVYAMTPFNGVLYIGGGFTTLGGLTRNYIGAVNAETGVVPNWNPLGGGTVRAIAIRRRPTSPFAVTIVAGGDFTTMSGVSRQHLAAMNDNGNLYAWNPGTDGSVTALAVDTLTSSPYSVYVSGSFGTAAGQSRLKTAAIDVTGAATAWNPSIPGQCVCCEPLFCQVACCPSVDALAVSGSVVYIGGFYSTVGGADRPGLAAVDATSGAVTAWEPHVGGVLALATSGSTVYAGGSFNFVSGHPRRNIAFLGQSIAGVEDLHAAVAPGGLRTEPNPFRDHTSVRFTLASRQDADVVVHDVMGRQVRRLARGTLPAGEHRLVWNGRDEAGRLVEPGVYLVKAATGRTKSTAKILRLE